MIIPVKYLEQCLAHSKLSVNITISTKIIVICSFGKCSVLLRVQAKL